jgi:hypothetical protein
MQSVPIITDVVFNFVFKHNLTWQSHIDIRLLFMLFPIGLAVRVVVFNATFNQSVPIITDVVSSKPAQ